MRTVISADVINFARQQSQNVLAKVPRGRGHRRPEEKRVGNSGHFPPADRFRKFRPPADVGGADFRGAGRAADSERAAGQQ